jgi:hypothetical protein
MWLNTCSLNILIRLLHHTGMHKTHHHPCPVQPHMVHEVLMLIFRGGHPIAHCMLAASTPLYWPMDACAPSWVHKPSLSGSKSCLSVSSHDNYVAQYAMHWKKSLLTSRKWWRCLVSDALNSKMSLPYYCITIMQLLEF